MKSLINSVKSILENAITAGTISKPTNIEAIDVLKGIKEDPTTSLVLQHFYIALDDGGERVEDTNSDTAQIRYYSIILEMGCATLDEQLALDYILDLSNQVKTVLEANRLKDGHIFGVSIVPMTITYDGNFFRGRQVTVDYFETEDRDPQY